MSSVLLSLLWFSACSTLGCPNKTLSASVRYFSTSFRFESMTWRPASEFPTAWARPGLGSRLGTSKAWFPKSLCVLELNKSLWHRYSVCHHILFYFFLLFQVVYNPGLRKYWYVPAAPALGSGLLQPGTILLAWKSEGQGRAQVGEKLLSPIVFFVCLFFLCEN